MYILSITSLKRFSSCLKILTKLPTNPTPSERLAFEIELIHYYDVRYHANGIRFAIWLSGDVLASKLHDETLVA